MDSRDFIIGFFTTREWASMTLFTLNTHITRRELADTIGINQSAIQKHIEVLVNNGNIARKGRTRGSFFIILKQL